MAPGGVRPRTAWVKRSVAPLAVMLSASQRMSITRCHRTFGNTKGNMEVIGRHELWTFDSEGKIEPSDNAAVRRGRACPVKSYFDLATRVAELQFRNRDHVLLFRGQGGDHKDSRRHTTLKPNLFRGSSDLDGIPSPGELLPRFKKLADAERLLSEAYSQRQFLGFERLARQRIVRWSVLQHYEMCLTPLLDVTYSLRVAASFASLGGANQAYVFVLGVPNLSGAVTASAEAGLQIIRLSSVCPPVAVRPHIQEGYLLGEYPDLDTVERKANYPHTEIDFGRRLIAKFCFNPAEFRLDGAFPLIPKETLYPVGPNDRFCETAELVKRRLDRTSTS